MKLKVIIEKSGALKVSRLFKVTRWKKEGKSISRVSGQALSPPAPEKDGENQPKLEHSANTKENGENPPENVGIQDKSVAKSEIATSRNSMRLEMKNTLGDISSRLCELYQGSTTTLKA